MRLSLPRLGSAHQRVISAWASRGARGLLVQASRPAPWSSSYFTTSSAITRTTTLYRSFSTEPAKKNIKSLFINDEKQVDALLPYIERAEIVAMDTEFISFPFYTPKLELVQIGTPECLAVVDYGVLGDKCKPILQAVWDKPMAVHACRYDIMLLQKALKLTTPPACVIDTQVVAAYLGRGETIGLKDLLERDLGITLDKSETLSNWSNRPLRPEQIEYARSDVQHLLKLTTQLQQELEEKGRTEYYEEHIRAFLTTVDEKVAPGEAWQYVRNLWKVKDKKSLNVIKELCAWRETRAQFLNKQSRLILRDDVLVGIAEMQPKHEKQLDNLQGTHNLSRSARNILSAVKRGTSQPLSAAPVVSADMTILTAPQRQLVSLLTMYLSSKSESMQIANNVLATFDELRGLARADSEETLQNWAQTARCMSGWRREVIGQELMDIREGRLKMNVRWSPDTQNLEVE